MVAEQALFVAVAEMALDCERAYLMQLPHGRETWPWLLRWLTNGPGCYVNKKMVMEKRINAFEMGCSGG